MCDDCGALRDASTSSLKQQRLSRQAGFTSRPSPRRRAPLPSARGTREGTSRSGRVPREAHSAHLPPGFLPAAARAPTGPDGLGRIRAWQVRQDPLPATTREHRSSPARRSNGARALARGQPTPRARDGTGRCRGRDAPRASRDGTKGRVRDRVLPSGLRPSSPAESGEANPAADDALMRPLHQGNPASW